MNNNNWFSTHKHRVKKKSQIAESDMDKWNKKDCKSEIYYGYTTDTRKLVNEGHLTRRVVFNNELTIFNESYLLNTHV